MGEKQKRARLHHHFKTISVEHFRGTTEHFRSRPGQLCDTEELFHGTFEHVCHSTAEQFICTAEHFCGTVEHCGIAEGFRVGKFLGGFRVGKYFWDILRFSQWAELWWKPHKMLNVLLIRIFHGVSHISMKTA